MPTALLPLLVLGAFLGVACLERVRALRFVSSAFLRPWFGTDLIWQLFALGVPMLARPWLAQYVPPGVIESWREVPLVVSAATAIVLHDGVACAIHVLLHRFDVLWAVHKVHHSSRTLDWLATTRQHVLEGLARSVPAQAVLLFAGLPLEAVSAAIGVYAIFAVLGHSNLRVNLRWLEPLFVTPRIHRRHHVPETTQNNFGTTFSIWDRLMGSLVVRDTSPDEALGVPGEVESYPQSFRRALLEPLRGSALESSSRASAPMVATPESAPPGCGAGGLGRGAAGPCVPPSPSPARAWHRRACERS
jgi:sterol desaturase/sphingolipid hydroxylase (fatty acid hydroxylase superfamily)